MKILTFDIEEWFHILDNDSTKTKDEWIKYPSRIHKNMDLIFEILEKNNVKASFFVLGWIAKKYPDIVKEINSRGYEIGSHTFSHQLIYNQSRNDFFQDVNSSIKILEDLTGKKVKIFRAPGFSIIEQNKWAFEILYELGIKIDSSIFPTQRAHGGLPSYNYSLPSIIKYNGVEIKEFPINTMNSFNYKFVFSGGGYFRLFPYYFIKYFSKQSKYIMSYLHPRDFDKDQPVINDLSILRKFKSYYGLKNTEFKLNKWLNDFNFIDINNASKKINWDKIKIINI